MNIISCSAPGKVILAGEHAVVHGCPAIATAVDLRLVTTLELLPESLFKLNLLDLKKSFQARVIGELAKVSNPDFPLFQAVFDFLKARGPRGPMSKGFSLSMSSKIPVSAGLGSSAAACACLISILSRWFEIDLNPEEFLSASKSAEKIYHSNPSGIDTTATIKGGIFLFQNGRIIDSISKEITLNGDLIIVDTGVTRNTGKMVDGVKKALERDHQAIESCFEEISVIVKDTWALLKAGTPRIEEIGANFSRNQHELEKIGVSTPVIEHVIKVGLTHGATGGKLTGAGGGGCVILACPRLATPKIINALESETLNVIKTKFSREGIICDARG